MYLFLDTETADKPRNWKAPASDLDNWPRALADTEACMRCFFRPA